MKYLLDGYVNFSAMLATFSPKEAQKTPFTVYIYSKTRL